MNTLSSGYAKYHSCLISLVSLVLVIFFGLYTDQLMGAEIRNQASHKIHIIYVSSSIKGDPLYVEITEGLLTKLSAILQTQGITLLNRGKMKRFGPLPPDKIGKRVRTLLQHDQKAFVLAVHLSAKIEDREGIIYKGLSTVEMRFSLYRSDGSLLLSPKYTSNLFLPDAPGTITAQQRKEVFQETAVKGLEENDQAFAEALSHKLAEEKKREPAKPKKKKEALRLALAPIFIKGDWGRQDDTEKYIRREFAQSITAFLRENEHIQLVHSPFDLYSRHTLYDPAKEKKFLQKLWKESYEPRVQSIEKFGKSAGADLVLQCLVHRYRSYTKFSAYLTDLRHKKVYLVTHFDTRQSDYLLNRFRKVVKTKAAELFSKRDKNKWEKNIPWEEEISKETKEEEKQIEAKPDLFEPMGGIGIGGKYFAISLDSYLSDSVYLRYNLVGAAFWWGPDQKNQFEAHYYQSLVKGAIDYKGEDYFYYSDGKDARKINHTELRQYQLLYRFTSSSGFFINFGIDHIEITLANVDEEDGDSEVYETKITQTRPVFYMGFSLGGWRNHSHGFLRLQVGVGISGDRNVGNSNEAALIAGVEW